MLTRTRTSAHTLHMVWNIASIVLLIRLIIHESYTTVTKKKKKNRLLTRISKTRMLLRQLRKKNNLRCIKLVLKISLLQKTLFSRFVLKRRKICIAINIMSNSQEKRLAFIAAVLGNKVKRSGTESHRRHKNICTCGGKELVFWRTLFFKSPRWCSLDLSTDYHLEGTHKNNTGLA